MRIIEVVPYDDAWPEAFERIRAELAPALEGLALAIEHVGSTSVPGLWAKPIIDIDIVLPVGGFGPAREALAGIGYTHQGNQGIPGREAFKYEGKEHLLKHHLYACEEGAAELLRHMALRGHLRADAEARDAYSSLKRALAQAHPHDIDAYIEGKGPLIRSIYEKCGVP